jgi:hypothetical protein
MCHPVSGTLAPLVTSIRSASGCGCAARRMRVCALPTSGEGNLWSFGTYDPYVG